MILNYIPLPETVYIMRQGELDEWGLPVATGESEPIMARVTDNTELKTISVSNGDLVVYAADILLEGVPDLTYKDTVKWTDLLGNESIKTPIKISIKRDFSGNAVAVKVVV